MDIYDLANELLLLSIIIGLFFMIHIYNIEEYRKNKKTKYIISSMSAFIISWFFILLVICF